MGKRRALSTVGPPHSRMRNTWKNRGEATTKKAHTLAESREDGYRKLSADERRMVWDEKVEAWALARAELEGVDGFTWWNRFEAIMKREPCHVPQRTRHDL